MKTYTFVSLLCFFFISGDSASMFYIEKRGLVESSGLTLLPILTSIPLMVDRCTESSSELGTLYRLAELQKESNPSFADLISPRLI